MYICATMSLPAPSESDPLLARQDHRKLLCCCKLSYKPRKFSSKGAVLVLVWQFLVACGVFITELGLESNQKHSPLRLSLEISGAIPLFLAAIISGWLADTKVGRSRIVQTGLTLTWLGVVLETACNTVTLTVSSTSIAANVIIQVVQYVALYATCTGAATFFTNVVQFGLEQMPDASSDAMTAFILWITIVTALGQGSYEIMRSLIVSNCIDHLHVGDHNVIRSIVGCALLSIAMCSKFLFSHWLIDHRQNHNPLKTVYRVLKFAKQHKYPVNRSAFTYCEDEIPSRIDLGKSKYGGPFTTEEVEDVKTFFRILLVLAVIYAIAIAIFLINAVPFPSTGASFLSSLIESFKGYFTAAVFLIYAYIVYPCIKVRYRLSMLKQIGFCILCGVVMVFILFVYAAVTEAGLVDPGTIAKAHRLNRIIFNLLINVILVTFLYTTLQFVYSQAPEHMKGFLIFWTWVPVLAVIAVLNHKFF